MVAHRHEDLLEGVHVAVVRRVAGSRDLVGTASEFLEVLVERELTPRFLGGVVEAELGVRECIKSEK
jgi:hypothetical protein